jgi:hypothetical protein
MPIPVGASLNIRFSRGRKYAAFWTGYGETPRTKKSTCVVVESHGTLFKLVAAGALYKNAVFFSFAIYLASVVTLARANFGIGADGMGAITMKITWTVSTLTLLPLLPLILRPQLFANSVDADAPRANAPPKLQVLGKKQNETLLPSSCVSNSGSKRHYGYRFLIFVVTWAASFYAFFSHMTGMFSKSRIPSLHCDFTNTKKAKAR